jgi:DNA-binding NarL/FixJ family response regulator
MNATNPFSVLVAHDDPVIAAGLAAVLQEAGDLCVAVRASHASLESFAPCWIDADVVVADYRSGLACLEQATQAVPGRGVRPPKVMVLTMLYREEDIRSAMRAGVRGYMLQGSPVEELINGVRLLARGSRYLCDTVAQRIADSLTREELTCRETEVLHLLTRGFANKSIARELGIAIGTVKTHVKGILDKLDARTRTHAVAVAAERGLVHGEKRSIPSIGAVLNGTRLPSHELSSYA